MFDENGDKVSLSNTFQSLMKVADEGGKSNCVMIRSMNDLIPCVSDIVLFHVSQNLTSGLDWNHR